MLTRRLCVCLDSSQLESPTLSGALALLQKYTKLFCASAYQVIEKATQRAREGTMQFIASAEALEHGLIGMTYCSDNVWVWLCLVKPCKHRTFIAAKIPSVEVMVSGPLCDSAYGSL